MAHLWSGRTIKVIFEEAKGAPALSGLATDTKERKLPHYFAVFRHSGSFGGTRTLRTGRKEHDKSIRCRAESLIGLEHFSQYPQCSHVPSPGVDNQFHANCLQRDLREQ